MLLEGAPFSFSSEINVLTFFFAQNHISSDVFSFYERTTFSFLVWWVGSPQEKIVPYKRTNISP